MLDCHLHIMGGSPDSAGLASRLAAAGVDGALLISLAPRCFPVWAGENTTRERIENLFGWVGTHPRLFPFYWIDPTEDDALGQVELAVKRGVHGFKCICDRFYPSDGRAQAVFRAVAQAGKPLLLHSGILWDGNDSSRYNRPVEFEALLDIPRLKVALAHISWPWCDELIAVYGKFQAARKQRPDEVAELFVDTTPGTPQIYREEALRKLFTVGYDVKANVMLGSDQLANTYDSENVKDMIARDAEILRGLGLDDGVIAGVMGGNLERFL